MYNGIEPDGISQAVPVLLAAVTIGGIILTVLGVVYAVRTWLAQSAAFQTRRDVADIKQMLQKSKQPTQPASPTINDGPKIARD